jgi:hypothetical protein
MMTVMEMAGRRAAFNIEDSELGSDSLGFPKPAGPLRHGPETRLAGPGI